MLRLLLQRRRLSSALATAQEAAVAALAKQSQACDTEEFVRTCLHAPAYNRTHCVRLVEQGLV